MPGDNDRTIRKAIQHTSAANKNTLLEFLQVKRAQRLKVRSLAQYARHIQDFDTFFGKPFREATAKDLVGYFSHLANNGCSPGYQGLKASLLRTFYKWLFLDEPRPESFWECFRIRGRAGTKPRRPLSPDELELLFNAARYVRDRAAMMLLWDTGFRRSELAALNVESIAFDDHGPGMWVRIPTDGVNLKTGPRDVYVTRAVPVMKTYLRMHPKRTDPNAPLFFSLFGKRKERRIDPKDIGHLVKSASIRVGIRPVSPHLLRHTRATEAARAGWNEAKMRLFFGWSKNSRQPSNYTHLTTEDLRDQVLADGGYQKTPVDGAKPSKPRKWTKVKRMDPADMLIAALADRLQRRLSTPAHLDGDDV